MRNRPYGLQGYSALSKLPALGPSAVNGNPLNPQGLSNLGFRLWTAWLGRTNCSIVVNETGREAVVAMIALTTVFIIEKNEMIRVLR